MDMFAEEDKFYNKLNSTTSKALELENVADLTDDEQGYYRARVGEVLDHRYTVSGITGQGAFSSVVRASDQAEKVAIKISRGHDFMLQSGLRELEILRRLNAADPEDKHHCLRLLRHFHHKHHLCLVLEPMMMNLREVLHKYGKNVGLNIQAVRSYSRQLLLALQLLQKVGILHTDIKPDNIVVNESKMRLKLCDFGTATHLVGNDLTPYRGSRFYRAPEMIIGAPHDHGVDMWSAACTMYELATGRIMFHGKSNNEMLKLMMELNGMMPKKMIKKSNFKDQHFDQDCKFMYQAYDPITKMEKVVKYSCLTPTRELFVELAESPSTLTTAGLNKLMQLKNLMKIMLTLEPVKRASIDKCLAHPFIVDSLCV